MKLTDNCRDAVLTKEALVGRHQVELAAFAVELDEAHVIDAARAQKLV